MRDVLVREASVGDEDRAEIKDTLHVWISLLAGSEIVKMIDENWLYDVRGGYLNSAILDVTCSGAYKRF